MLCSRFQTGAADPPDPPDTTAMRGSPIGGRTAALPCLNPEAPFVETVPPRETSLVGSLHERSRAFPVVMGTMCDGCAGRVAEGRLGDRRRLLWRLGVGVLPARRLVDLHVHPRVTFRIPSSGLSAPAIPGDSGTGRGGRDVPPCSHFRFAWLRGVLYRLGEGGGREGWRGGVG